jgi:adenylate cyclase
MTAFAPRSAARWLTGCFLLAGILWGGFLGIRDLTGAGSFLDGVENLTLDWRYGLAGPRPAPRDVVIAAIDNEAAQEAGAYPLPRDKLAKIVVALGKFKPRVIALDMVFLTPTNAAADAELADALASTTTAIAAVGEFAARDLGVDSALDADHALVPRPSGVLWPLPSFRDVARVGLVNLATDASGEPRFIPMIFRWSEGFLPALALAAASAALNAEPVFAPGSVRLAATKISLDLGNHLPLRFYGPRGSFEQFSVASVLRGELDAAVVRDKVVLIGATATGVGDIFATPFDRTVPGVEVLATGIANLLTGDSLIRTLPIRRIDAAAALVLPCLAVLLMSMRSPIVGVAIGALVVAIWAAIAFIAFLDGVWLSVAAPVAAFVPVALGYGAARLALERYSADRLGAEKEALTRFQSPLLLDHILKKGGFLEKPVEQQAAVLFVDLSGFTGMAEAVGPMAARDFLSQFQSIVEREVSAQGGFVASFMGDGAMILFGLPEAGPDDAARALRAVDRLRSRVTDWLVELPSPSQNRLSLRIGGHLGPVVLSRLGGVSHQHFAATGDTVNVASRLLEVGKQKGLDIVVSEALLQAGEDRAAASEPSRRIRFEAAIRGRAQTLSVEGWT